jgi:hypothetical protein
MGSVFLNCVSGKIVKYPTYSSSEQSLVHKRTIVTIDEIEAIVVDSELTIWFGISLIYEDLPFLEDHL